MSISRHIKQCLSHQSKHSHLNAFISLADPAAIGSYADSAVHVPRDNNSNALHGFLVAVKDNICTTQLPTTAASKALRTFTSPYDATVVRLLQQAGAAIAGKTNMDEFGMGSHSIHSAFGAVKQHDTRGEELSVGGSSGGSAIAVASGQCSAYV